MASPERPAVPRRGSVASAVFLLRRLGWLLRADLRLVRGRGRRTCPLCHHTGWFSPYGDPPRADAECPRCGSLERHRLLCLALDEEHLVAGQDVLHFAPEPAVRAFTTLLGARSYLSCDLEGINGAQRADIEAMPEIPSEHFDLAIVSHVLEHVDDRKALAELHRVLRPGGTLAVMVPLIASWSRTYENPDIVSDHDRVRHFGQADHVRYYGADIETRLADAGFVTRLLVAEEPAVSFYALDRGETVLLARRAPA